MKGLGFGHERFRVQGQGVQGLGDYGFRATDNGCGVQG